ncbi:MAG: hypothetical protein NC827_05995 [Candidatus Omnitrophica bacterium]|nr:hypothetical protein [Candidatus Omnitrophota bacterium]
MSWVSVPKDYDAPYGEKIRIIIQIDVPEWLGWIPSQITQFIINSMSSIWSSILNAHPEFDVERYDVIEIIPSRKYHLIIYGVSKGVNVWLVATIILGLILAVMIVFNITIKDVQKFIETLPFPAILILIAIILFLLLVSRKE